MFLSKPVSYAVRALTYLAQHPDAGPHGSATIAEAQSIPAPFLTKILRLLTTAGFIASVRGPGGGFALVKAPEQISLLDVHSVFEGVALTDNCLLGHGKCADSTPCAVHDLWREPKKAMLAFLESTTIADLAGVTDRPKRRSKK